MTRPIELVQAEAIDAASELAECVRESASMILLRADRIERVAKFIMQPPTQEEDEEVHEQAQDLQADMAINRMREDELTIRYQRLTKEYAILKHRESRK